MVRAGDGDAAADCGVVAAIERAGGNDPRQRGGDGDPAKQQNQLVGQTVRGQILILCIRRVRSYPAALDGVCLRWDR